MYYRGVVKWYHRGLQNLWWEFDSLIPCFFKNEYRLEPLILLMKGDLNGASLRTVKSEVTRTPFWVFFLYPIFFQKFILQWLCKIQ